MLIINNKKLEKSYCYDEYWHFSYQRQERFRSKTLNLSPPENSTLDRFKFTNCYRALDRTSQYLIKNVIADDRYAPEDTFFRVVLFKIFNKIETWEHLEKKIGEINTSTYSEIKYNEILADLRAKKQKIYSAAYIMPSGKNEFGSPVKHVNNLRMISHMLRLEMHHRVWDYKHLKDTFNMFLSVPTIGNFLAYQYAIDIGYSRHSTTSESQFVIAGPGAVRGIQKCFTNVSNQDHGYIIEHMTEIQDSEYARLNLPFKHLRNRKLQLIDCQNLFCEVDKYLRQTQPHVGKPGARIKQLYKPHSTPIEYQLPPKWNASIE